MSEPDPAGILQEQGRGWLKEAGELRKVKIPGHDAGPTVMFEALLTVRGNLDRVEEILGQAMVTRSGTALKARELTERADDELDREIVKRSKRARDFESARERLADASLTVLSWRQQARSAQKLADMAATVEAQIRLAYRGLDALRSDLQTALRHVSWESSLDR